MDKKTKKKPAGETFEELPMVPLRDVVVFPHMIIPFVVGRPSSVRAIEETADGAKRIFLATQLDARVDDPSPEEIYSVGVVAYYLLTGAPPFRADSIPKLMDKIVNDRHTELSTIRDDLPACVDELFDRVLAKDPADRYGNGRAMALALRDCCSKFDG